MREEGFVAGTEDVRLTIEILVPSTQVGRIIGKGGQNVRELQRVTGSIIKLSEQQSTSPSADEEATVQIIGPFFSVQVIILIYPFPIKCTTLLTFYERYSCKIGDINKCQIFLTGSPVHSRHREEFAPWFYNPLVHLEQVLLAHALVVVAAKKLHVLEETAVPHLNKAVQRRNNTQLSNNRALRPPANNSHKISNITETYLTPTKTPLGIRFNRRGGLVALTFSRQEGYVRPPSRGLCILRCAQHGGHITKTISSKKTKKKKNMSYNIYTHAIGFR